jgi:hypothetical protein
MDTTTQKDKLARFGRSVALMLNRSLMYQKSHPMVQDSIKEVVTIADVLFFALSPMCVYPQPWTILRGRGAFRPTDQC